MRESFSWEVRGGHEALLSTHSHEVSEGTPPDDSECTRWPQVLRVLGLRAVLAKAELTSDEQVRTAEGWCAAHGYSKVTELIGQDHELTSSLKEVLVEPAVLEALPKGSRPRYFNKVFTEKATVIHFELKESNRAILRGRKHGKAAPPCELTDLPSCHTSTVVQ